LMSPAVLPGETQFWPDSCIAKHEHAHELERTGQSIVTVE
jgi:hypothetical protein